MIGNNEKHHIKGNISDFNAVSLYPSPMKRLYLILWKPIVFDFIKHINNDLRKISREQISIKSKQNIINWNTKHMDSLLRLR